MFRRRTAAFSKVNHLFHRGNRLLVVRAILKHCRERSQYTCARGKSAERGNWESGKHTESQLFERSAARLGVQEEDGAELEKDPATVDGQVLPLNGRKRNRVDVGREEPRELSKDLLDADAAAAMRVGPQLDEIGCRLFSIGPHLSRSGLGGLL